MAKIGLAVGAGIGLAIAGWYGFDATVTTQKPENVVGLVFAMVWLPIFFLVSALIFNFLNPINSRRHKIIRRSLDFRLSRDL